MLVAASPQSGSRVAGCAAAACPSSCALAAVVAAWAMACAGAAMMAAALRAAGQEPLAVSAVDAKVTFGGTTAIIGTGPWPMGAGTMTGMPGAVVMAAAGVAAKIAVGVELHTPSTPTSPGTAPPPIWWGRSWDSSESASSVFVQVAAAMSMSPIPCSASPEAADGAPAEISRVGQDIAVAPGALPLPLPAISSNAVAGASQVALMLAPAAAAFIFPILSPFAISIRSCAGSDGPLVMAPPSCPALAA
mmetsp:Transcript_68924/g.136645  ORF Transcript_68924/g.136645 Transcript_68924/m.136645 type:complete len:248 (+) Transcript_68924:703-1446(+)